jgi:hypothetical protein
LRLRRRSRAPISCYTHNARATAWEFLNNGITNASTGTGKRNQIFATAVCDNIVGQHLAFPRGVLGGRRLVSAMFIGNHGPGTTHAFERLSKCSAPLRLGKVFILHCLSQSARITWTEPGKCPAPLQPFDISFVVKATVGYQALDRHFQAAFHATLDFLLSAKQDAAAARRLLAKALGRQNHPVPRVINTDGHSAYPPAIVRLKVEGALDEDCWHRPVPCLNSQHFRSFLACMAHDRRLRGDPYDPQRPSVLECSESGWECSLLTGIAQGFRI